MDKLIQAAEKAQAELEALTASATPDKAAVEGKTAEVDGLLGKIEQAKSQAKRRALLARAKADGEIDVEGKSNLGEYAQAKDHPADQMAKEDGFRGFLAGEQLSDRMYEALAPKSESFKSARQAGAQSAAMPDRWAVAVMGKAYAKAFGKALPMAGAVPQIVPAAGAMQIIAPDFRAMLLELPPETGHLLPLVTVVPAPTGSIYWPILTQTDADEYGGISGEWITEGASKPDTEASIKQKRIMTYEYAAYTEVSNRLLARSAIPVEPLITRLFREKIMDALDTAFTTGHGLGRPLGICDPSSGVRVVSRNVAGTVSYDDWVNLEHAVRANHRAGARYLAQDNAVRVGKLQKSATTLIPLWTPNIGLGISNTMNGYPYIASHRSPALGSRGDIVFGDWSWYFVAMEEEITVQRSVDYQFKKNLTALRVSVVVGGDVVEPRAFSILDTLAASTTNAAQATTTAGR